MSLLTIITINYNNRSGLEKTIQSVCSQKYKPFEFIIIDGGSTDNSIEIIEKYSSHISSCVSEKDSGIYNAMNKGILKASGEYIYFLNSGDYFADEDVLSNIFKDNFVAGFDFILGNVEIDQKVKKGFENLSLYKLIELGVSHQSMFIKKNCFLKYGMYDENYKILADTNHLILCLLKYSCTYKYLDLVVAKVESGGVSDQSFLSNQNERHKFLQNEFPLLVEDYNDLIRYKKADLIKRGTNFIKRRIGKK